MEKLIVTGPGARIGAGAVLALTQEQLRRRAAFVTVFEFNADGEAFTLGAEPREVEVPDDLDEDLTVVLAERQLAFKFGERVVVLAGMEWTPAIVASFAREGTAAANAARKADDHRRDQAAQADAKRAAEAAAAEEKRQAAKRAREGRKPAAAKPPRATPEQVAAELGVDLSQVTGTGKGGRITVADVRGAAGGAAGDTAAKNRAGQGNMDLAGEVPPPESGD